MTPKCATSDLLEHAKLSSPFSDEDFQGWFDNLDLSEAKDFILEVRESAKAAIAKAEREV